MFKKLFGKKDGFYMQVDESAPPIANAPKAEAPKTKTEAAPAKVSPAAEIAGVAPPVVAEFTAATDQANQTDKKAKSAKTSIKKDKKDKKEDAKAKVPSEVVAAVADTVAPSAPAITNFATDYLVIPAVAGNRRRPGANMKGFMTMAREVKETKKGSQGNQQVQQKIEEAKKA